MHAKPPKKSNCFAYDYGVKPTIMILGDVDFQTKLGPHFVALGYTLTPTFEDLVNVPTLGMLFDSEDSARDCFDRLSNWATGSKSGDAVGIGFVEFKNGGFGMCIYQEHDKLAERTIPQEMRSELNPVFMTATYMKSFPRQSEGYSWFKVVAQNSPFLLVPAGKDAPPLWDKAIRKKNANFYPENEVPEHSAEGAVLRSSHAESDSQLHRPIPEAFELNPKGVIERRRSQLRRFFPVTLERTRKSEEYALSRAVLNGEGYRDWQIIQASCNLTLHCRFAEDFKTPGSKVNLVDILAKLVESYEPVSTAQTSRLEANIDVLRIQIDADAAYLLDNLKRGGSSVNRSKTQAELLKRGFLD
jgi:hypothetical protein